ncbi:hypothetical protein [Vulcanisaeta thermophila]|uniref:hypothetical protein n=1 Tax=Vulcanisaeta thermophila TaxID=867917 RepID=UPI000852A645|nr:hypothetical protein [Vulcanisaeta thermophila]
MLILIHGSRGLDYIISELNVRRDINYSVMCTEGMARAGIDLELNGDASIRIANVWGRVLRLRDNEHRALIDALTTAKTLREAINQLINTHEDYGADRLYAIATELSMLDIWRAPGEGCVPTPFLEPIKTLVSTAMLTHVVIKGGPASVVVSSEYVDEIADLLTETRGLGNVYVHTNTMPRELGVFDDVLITTMELPRELFGRLIRVRGGEKSELLGAGAPAKPMARGAAVARGVDGDVLEIIKTASELGFVTLNSLLDMMQASGLSRDGVLQALIRAVSMNLVKVRYLSDGRVVVTPTLRGIGLLINSS